MGRCIEPFHGMQDRVRVLRHTVLTLPSTTPGNAIEEMCMTLRVLYIFQSSILRLRLYLLRKSYLRQPLRTKSWPELVSLLPEWRHLSHLSGSVDLSSSPRLSFGRETQDSPIEKSAIEVAIRYSIYLPVLRFVRTHAQITSRCSRSRLLDVAPCPSSSASR